MGPANHVVYIIVVHYSSLCCASSRTESDFNDGSGGAIGGVCPVRYTIRTWEMISKTLLLLFFRSVRLEIAVKVGVLLLSCYHFHFERVCLFFFLSCLRKRACLYVVVLVVKIANGGHRAGHDDDAFFRESYVSGVKRADATRG